MKRPIVSPSDGLDWLRAIRRKIQSEIGITPQERAFYYQAKEKTLCGRLYPGRSGASATK